MCGTSTSGRPLPPSEGGEVEFGRLRPDEVDAVARLHFTFFGGPAHAHSLARMGPRFLADVFYRVNLDNPYFFCDVARHGGRIVAFIVYASDGRRIFRHTLRTRFCSVAAGILRQAVRDPVGVAGHLLSNLAFVSGTTPPEVAEDPGVFLLLGVLPEYRSREFRERTRVWVAGALWDRMEASLRAAGCPSFWSAPGAHNGPINQLLETFGAALVARGPVQGIVSNYYRKTLRTQPRAGA